MPRRLTARQLYTGGVTALALIRIHMAWLRGPSPEAMPPTAGAVRVSRDGSVEVFASAEEAAAIA